MSDLLDFKFSPKKVIFFARELVQQMWFRCCLYCLLALVPFVLGPIVSDFIPKGLKEIVSADALQKILTVIATSMLAVTTFSLSIMVQALHTASTTATPRASRLLMENSPAQNALGAFIGSFLFSITGIIGMSGGFYSKDVVTILFLLTVAMLVLVVVMLLQWIKQLSKLGRVSVTIKLVEDQLAAAVKSYNHDIRHARKLELDDERKSELEKICPEKIGYVRYIDYAELGDLAEEHDLSIYVAAAAGDFLDGREPIFYLSRSISDETLDALRSAIVVDRERTYAQDPRYGFATLTEIALRALSPGINDPGTAIEAMRSQYRAMHRWQDACDESRSAAEKDDAKRIFASHIADADLFHDMLMPLISQAAQYVTVAQSLKQLLVALKGDARCDCADVIDRWIQKLDQCCDSHLQGHEREAYQSL